MFERLIRYDVVTSPLLYHHPNGCGDVYKATDLLFARVVALKTINEAFLMDNREIAFKQFKYECQAQAKLHEESNNIVAVYDYGQLGSNNLFYSMEFMEGGSADFDCGNVTFLQAQRIVLQILQALETAHKKDVIHGDVAPANILCDRERHLYKLGDFGAATFLKPGVVSRISISPYSAKREDFTPKEHLYDIRRVNYSTDVFALVATFFTLISGELLPHQPDGLHYVPGVVKIKKTGQQVGDRVRRFFERFIVNRRDGDTLSDFRREFEHLG